MRRYLACALFLTAGLLPGSVYRPCAVAEPSPPGQASLRHPVAAVLAENGRWLFTANQRSGTVSIIDLQNPAAAREVKIGGSIVDVALSPDGKYFVAADEGTSEVILCRRAGPMLEPLHRIKLPIAPAHMQLSTDGSRCYVSLLWSRRIAMVDLAPALATDSRAPRVLGTIELPFPPRKLLLLAQEEKLLVADAFAGRLALVDLPHKKVESVRSLPAQNQRGLALTSDRTKLLVAHQTLNHLATTAEDDIHWGNLLTNNLRMLPLSDLLNPNAELLRNSSLDQLGDPGRGGGDPSDVAVCPDGTVLATLAGVIQVAIAGAIGAHYQHLRVGTRPSAVALSPDHRRAYVVNTFDDSISIIDVAARKAVATISLGTQPELTAADRGERLFFSARLAHDGWFSCQSCHPDGHTIGALVDNLSDGSYGTPKRVLSLRGVADTGPWAWNGSMPTLETQVRKSTETTMRGRALTEEQVADLTAFLRMLPPPPRLLPIDPIAGERGKKVFHDHNCQACHAPPAYTSEKTYDVGLTDEVGNTRFNPPSLRGVVHGGPFFHDGRAATLEEVFTRYRHQLKKELTAQELADLLAWLRSL